VPHDLNFLAPPDDVLDWRFVVLVATSERCGIFDSLPGSAEEIAARLELDDHSIRAVLDALALWHVVTGDAARYEAGPAMPDTDQLRTIVQHAEFLGRWSDQLESRMSTRILAERRRRSPESLSSWLAALGVRAREAAPATLATVLDAHPNPRSVLDVAGGHAEYGIEAARRGLDVTMLDLPPVVEVVKRWPRVIDAGIRLEAGDAFTTDLGRQFDIVLCFGFAHTRPADELPNLFANLAKMTQPDGIIAINTLLRGSSPRAALFAVQMLIAGNGGGAHQLSDYTTALESVGFGEVAHHMDGDRHILLARRGAR
jgi:2-polyprenyl-3-methyl-5-hydroxy-6-metoxy-1,4-benzoquinol methylase